MTSTKTNFIIVGVALALVTYLAVRPQVHDCEQSDHTLLALIDFTDPIGADAVSTIKNTVWSAILNLPDNSKVIFKPILGSDSRGGPIDRKAVEFCRPEKPNALTGLSGPAVDIAEKWQKFMDKVCGSSKNGDSKISSCGDMSRVDNFFGGTYKASQSSPIYEEIVDDFRTHLGDVKTWHLIVASDWKQYTPPTINLHTQKCNNGAISGAILSQLLVGKNQKIFNDGNPKDKNTVEPLFVLRSDMTASEADCLEQVSDNVLRALSYSPPPEFPSKPIRLSVTQSTPR